MEKMVFGNNEYTIVDKVPNGYIIWNIGNYMGTPDYVPFVQLFPNTYSVVEDTMLAVKLPREEVKLLRDVAGRGNTDLKTMRKRINRHAKYDYPVAILEEAYKILERVYG